MPKRTREEDKGAEPRRSHRKRTRTSFGDEFEVDETVGGAGSAGIGGPSTSTSTPAADPGQQADPEPEPPTGKTVTWASSPSKWKQPLLPNHVAGDVWMNLMPASHVKEAIAGLEEQFPQYSTLLKFGAVAEGPGHTLFQSLMEPTHSIVGKAPHDFKYMKKCTNIPSPLTHLTGDQTCKLYEFLDINDKYQLIPTEFDGDCCYGAFRRGTTLPYKVSDAHVRRVVVKALCQYHEFFFDLFSYSLSITYGLERDAPEVLQQKIDKGTASPDNIAAQRLPGPFTYIDFLKFMSKSSSYADVHILLVMSMIWQIRITCLYADNLHELRFCHHKRLAQADLVIVACSTTDHFISTVRYENHFDEEGHKYVDFIRLQHAPIQKVDGYFLKDEPKGTYKKEQGYEPDREWEEELPGDGVASEPQPGSSTDPEPVPPAFMEKIRVCQKVHDLQAELLKGFGIDACRSYQQNQIDHILEAVQADDKECPLCHKKLNSGLAVKAHLRAKHQDTTPFQCETCEKYFGNNQLLRSHLKTHVDPKKFPCTHKNCKKAFPTLGRMNAHKKEHDPKNQLQCEYCDKIFTAKRNYGPHVKTCKERPDYDQFVRDHQCQFCPKAYFHAKDLKYHVRTTHASRSKQK